MKNRHNKKRNTAFLYEVLIKELTKSIIDEDNNRRRNVISILKKHFNRSTTLSKELQTYKSLYEIKQEEKELVEKIITESYTAYNKLDKATIFNLQGKLINNINKDLSRGTFLNFIPNYKELATINQFFNTSSPKQKVLLEEKIKGSVLTENKEEKELKPIDKLTYKVFVNNFNKKYNSLLKEQQEILTRYISSFSDGETDFKVFLNEQIHTIKEGLTSFLSSETKEDKIIEKVNEVLEVIENFKTQPVDNYLVGQVLRLQALTEEIKKDEH